MKNQEIKKMSLANIDGKLTPEEMENIMAGSITYSCALALAGMGITVAGGAFVTGGASLLLFLGGYSVATASIIDSCRR